MAPASVISISGRQVFVPGTREHIIDRCKRQAHTWVKPGSGYYMTSIRMMTSECSEEISHSHLHSQGWQLPVEQGLTKGQLESGLWYPLKPVMPQLQQAQLPPLNVQNEVPCEDCSIQIHHPVRTTPRNPFSCPYCIIHKNIQSLSQLLQKTKLLIAQYSCITICETQLILPLVTFPDPTRTERPSTFPGRTEYPNIWVGSCCKQMPNDGNVISPNCIMKSC